MAWTARYIMNRYVVLLGSIETQLSPTLIIEEVMLILVELSMWMPSVFGPFRGDVMVRPLTIMSRLLEKLMWKPLSLNMEKLHIFPLETSLHKFQWLHRSHDTHKRTMFSFYKPVSFVSVEFINVKYLCTY